MNELEVSYLFKDVALFSTYDRLKKAGFGKQIPQDARKSRT